MRRPTKRALISGGSERWTTLLVFRSTARDAHEEDGLEASLATRLVDTAGVAVADALPDVEGAADLVSVCTSRRSS